MRITLAEKTKRLRRSITTLEKRYGRGSFPERNSYLEQLIFYYVFYHANLTGARRALKSFRDDYVDWNEVRVSSLGEIGATLQNHNVTPEAAVPVRDVLNGIFNAQNRMSLDFLAEEESDDVIKFFQSVSGAQWDCARFLVSTLAHAKECPVTDHIKRVLGRVGLVASSSKDNEVRNFLKNTIQPKDYMRMFYAFVEHGKRTCYETLPECERCDLQNACVYRQAEIAEKERAEHAAARKKTAAKTGKGKKKKRSKTVDRKALLRKNRRIRAREKRKAAKAAKKKGR
ncbi:MAG: hypothetical protein ACYS8W_01965 [Planctomycetota bacterium]|jgi:endonuclease-3